MMTAPAKSSYPASLLWRMLTAALAATLLVGAPVLATRAQAQDANDTTDKTDNTTDKKAGLNLEGTESIDPNQPIKPNFLISVSVVGEAEPSATYLVDPAGNIGIKYAGIMSPVRIMGLTPVQAQKKIADFLTTYVKNPQVTVTIVNVPRPTIFIAGAVKNTGFMQITSETTLVEVLSKAITTSEADLTQVRVFHREKVNGEEKTSSATYNFDKFFAAKDGHPDDTQNPVLHDKDRIVVPSKNTSTHGTISVYGDVDKPQREIPLPIGQTMTVREAINLVGGPRTTANRKAITIRRPSIDKPLIIDLDKAEQGDPVYNIELKADDSIYVEKLENNAYINLTGGFVKPGKFVYDKRTTLTEAVGEAFGVAPFAKSWQGVIYRHPDDNPKNSRVIAFNWLEITKGKKPDIELQPGDTVSIPTGIPSQPTSPLQILSAIGGLGYFFNAFRY